jgi:hypothetical protein
VDVETLARTINLILAPVVPAILEIRISQTALEWEVSRVAELHR